VNRGRPVDVLGGMGKTIWAWARVLAGAGILVAVVWRLGTGALLDGLRGLNGWLLLAALGIGVATTVCCAWRWCIVARGLGIHLRLRDAMADYYRALFINSVLPSGILGDVHRAVNSGKATGSIARGVRAVVLERFAGQVVLITSGVVVLFAQPQLISRTHLTLVVAAVLAGGALICYILWRVRKLRIAVTDARRGLLGRSTLPGVLTASVLVLAGHIAMFVVAVRGAGSHTSLVKLLPLMLLALFAMTLPVNIGGWGPREGVTAWAFGAAGLGAAQGLTVAVLYGVLAFVAGLPGLVVIVRGAVRRIRVRRVVPISPVPLAAEPDRELVLSR
jgi:uncharacterized membrane protein YbhN (UPF0104 family)